MKYVLALTIVLAGCSARKPVRVPQLCAPPDVQVADYCANPLQDRGPK